MELQVQFLQQDIFQEEEEVQLEIHHIQEDQVVMVEVVKVVTIVQVVLQEYQAQQIQVVDQVVMVFQNQVLVVQV